MHTHIPGKGKRNRGSGAHLHRDLADSEQQQQAKADAQAFKQHVVQHKWRVRVAIHDVSEHVVKAYVHIHQIAAVDENQRGHRQANVLQQ